MLIWLFRAVSLVADTITWPIYYYLIDRPWLEIERRRQVHSRLEDPSDPHSAWVRTDEGRLSQQVTDRVLANQCQTIDELFRASVKKYGPKKYVGRRRILDERQPQPGNGPKLVKYTLTDEYDWIDYNEADRRIDQLGAGFLKQGVTRAHPVILYADSSMEWFLSAQALFRIGSVMVTLYTNLGLDEVVHAFQETQPKIVLAGGKLVKNLVKLINEEKIKDVDKIIVIDYYDQMSKNGKIPIVTLKEVEAANNNRLEVVDIKPEDTAFIMYTSGSSGIPKGVILSHYNVISATRNMMNYLLNMIDDLENWSSIAYLPLAHIFEFTAELIFTSQGISIGYGRPTTLTDTSPGLMKGQRGDLTLLKPTIFLCVPLLLERFKKAILDNVESKGAVARDLFHFAVDYKTRWTRAGYSTPFIDKLVFGKIRRAMGGRVQLVMNGGAPISEETQQFMSTIFGLNILQGYGSTETCACISAKEFSDYSLGRVGSPFPGTRIKLVDWPDGGYRATDKPPTGEIVVSGGQVAMGYFKLDQTTKEAFEVDKEGRRWFLTGDIGEIDKKGTLKIIDRKKDFVKLQHGEYISLGKIESVLKQSPFVANVCVCVDSTCLQPVALVMPNENELMKLADSLQVGQSDENLNLQNLCDHPAVVDSVHVSMSKEANKCKLKKSEVPARIKICAEEWTPDNGLLTPSMKIVRRCINQFYKKDIERLLQQVK